MFKNEIKKHPLGNIYESAIDYIDNPESIVGIVDGDDKLQVNNAISKMKQLYDNNKNLLLAWSQHECTSKDYLPAMGKSKKLPTDEVIYNSYNNRYYWSVDHFRTNKVWLFHKLDKKDLIYENTYFPFCGDAALSYPLIEMCGNERSYFLDEVLYLYRDTLITNERLCHDNVKKYTEIIRKNNSRYEKLN